MLPSTVEGKYVTFGFLRTWGKNLLRSKEAIAKFSGGAQSSSIDGWFTILASLLSYPGPNYAGPLLSS